VKKHVLKTVKEKEKKKDVGRENLDPILSLIFPLFLSFFSQFFLPHTSSKSRSNFFSILSQL